MAEDALMDGFTTCRDSGRMKSKCVWETLVLTMVDGDTKRRLWEALVGFVPPENSSPNKMDEACQAAVGALLKYFPPPKD